MDVDSAMCCDFDTRYGGRYVSKYDAHDRAMVSSGAYLLTRALSLCYCSCSTHEVQQTFVRRPAPRVTCHLWVGGEFKFHLAQSGHSLLVPVMARVYNCGCNLVYKPLNRREASTLHF